MFCTSSTDLALLSYFTVSLLLFSLPTQHFLHLVSLGFLLWHRARAGEQSGLWICSRAQGSGQGMGFRTGNGAQDRARGSGQDTFVPWQEMQPKPRISLQVLPCLFSPAQPRCELCVQSSSMLWGCVCVPRDCQDCSMMNNRANITPNEMCPSGLDLCGLHVSGLR